MSRVTRRQAIGIATAGTAFATVRMSSADAGVANDRLVKLIEAMEGFRNTIPPAQGLNEQNGESIKEVEPYLLSHLAGVAGRLGVKTRAECLVLLTYLKDAEVKVRFIAQQAIDKAVSAYPSGMSIGCLTDTGSECHRKMVLRFVELIGKLPA
jgi:hypothetical protein